MTKEKIQSTIDKAPYLKLRNLAEDEGRTISKMLEILCDSYTESQK